MKGAQDAGRISAVAAQGQRDLQQCAAEYGDLYTGQQFDPALYSALALASAFTATWLNAAELRMANRAGLWVFGLDWKMDFEARSLAEVRDLAGRCQAVAEGSPAAPTDPLCQFLADLRDEIATSAAHGWREIWADELRRLLVASQREWEWRSAAADGGRRPTFDEYLHNADNFGSTFVNVSHWLSTGELVRVEDVDAFRTASSTVQRVLRLLNDLATYERDLAWGDLNVLLLGVTRADVLQRVAQLIDDCQLMLREVGDQRPRLAAYLERQLGFCVGFYGTTDFWGRP
jgi:hypothetical protein